MKKSLLFLFILFILTSCDKIEGPYSETISNTTPPPGQDSAIRKVLLEDFTGHLCQGCPSAHREATSLHQLYGEQLIVVALHPNSSFSVTQTNPDSSFSYDFRTQQATDIYNEFIPASYPLPVGMINRIKYGSQWAVFHPTWGTKLAPLMTMSPDAYIRMEAVFSNDNRRVSCSVETEIINDLTGTYNQVVLWTEDSIINWQVDGPVKIANYIHNHVLRGSLTSVQGEPILSDPVAGTHITRLYVSDPVQPDAVPEHCNLVAFIYNTTTKEIVQAEEVKFIE